MRSQRTLPPIVIRGARVHNLKGVDCALPRNSLVVVTGPSGSGKSSLAFDTLYAEGQRRYLESLSPWARQFLEQMEKPAVESVTGLSPAVAIEQRTTVSHPRSTVGTVTEVHDLLRVLFAAAGEPHCPRCGRAVLALGPEALAERLLAKPEGAVLCVWAPVVRARKGSFQEELRDLLARGFSRARIDGRMVPLRDVAALDARKRHRVEVLIDRLLVRPEIRPRLVQSLERAFALAGEVVLVAFEGGREHLYGRRLACAECDLSLPEPTPRAFSFNSPSGACPECAGLGVQWEIDPARIVPDERLSLLDGALHPWQRHEPRVLREALEEFARRHRFVLDTPLAELAPPVRQALLHGDAHFVGVLAFFQERVSAHLGATGVEGLAEGDHYDEVKAYLVERTCGACDGARLRPESRAVTLEGHSLAALVRLPLCAAAPLFASFDLGGRRRAVLERVQAEIGARLQVLQLLGLDYLTLDRATTSLSSGELRRVRLAGQIGSRLQGILYVLDEPSVGLHPRDNEKLLGTLKGIRDRGNTVVVVEHDEETIRAADHLIDLGEGAGVHGGRVMYEGPPAAIDGSLTGRYLRGELKIPVPAARRKAQSSLRVLGAREHNLKDLDVAIPLGVLTAVTGVSGAGKSTLVDDILHRALAQRLHGSPREAGRHRALEGVEQVDKVIAVDQSPIGRTPRSNPATYTGAFAQLRELFSLLPEARARGYRPGRFSFNVKGGRCESCQGDGVRTIGMHFLPEVYVPCPACKGRRYNRETLEVLYRGHSIADVLALTVAEAELLFRAHPRLHRILATLVDVGLGYLRLGQSAATLSGGEAQRVKLARELARRETGRTVFLLDEPTTGLHFDDVGKLLHVLFRLVEAGNTVVVVEHNLEVVKSADHVIDLGPEGGERGGRVVAAGTPEQVARVRASHTGQRLLPLLAAARPQGRGRRGREERSRTA